MIMRIDFQKPDPRTILRSGDSLYIFTPKINRVEEYQTSEKHRAFCRPVFLALDSNERRYRLKKNYVLTLIGEEEFDSRKDRPC